MFAVDKGHKDIVQRLVSAGADVHIRDKVCGDMESVCQMLHIVPNGLGKILLYNSIYVPCIYMYTNAQFYGPDHFLGLYMCMRKGGREGKDIKCGL